jgi:hypothetical protein
MSVKYKPNFTRSRNWKINRLLTNGPSQQILLHGLKYNPIKTYDFNQEHFCMELRGIYNNTREAVLLCYLSATIEHHYHRKYTASPLQRKPVQ